MKSSLYILDIISHLLQETMNLFLNLIQRAFLQEHKGFVVSNFNSFLLGVQLLLCCCNLCGPEPMNSLIELIPNC